MPKKTNKILSDNGIWLEIDVSTEKHPNSIMKMLKTDFNYIKLLGFGRISAHRPSKSKCLYGQCQLRKKKYKVHRLLLPNSETVDHVDGDGLNNLRSNIRECSSSANNLNKSVRSGNSSGVTGVSRYKKTDKWISRISINGRNIWLGVFDEINGAIKIRREAENKYFGEYAHSA